MKANSPGAATRLATLGAYLWPTVPAAALLAAWLAFQWHLQHGARYDQPLERLLRSQCGTGLGLWTDGLRAAAVLARTRLGRRRRAVAANAFPFVLWGLLSLTPEGGSFLRMNDADLFVVLPAAVVSEVLPSPSFTSACDVSLWAVEAHGFERNVSAFRVQPDGGVLVAATARRSGDYGSPTIYKLGRITPGGQPDLAFADDRRCVERDPAEAFGEQDDRAAGVRVVYPPGSRDSARLERTGPDGRTDTSFARRAAAALAPYGPPAVGAPPRHPPPRAGTRRRRRRSMPGCRAPSTAPPPATCPVTPRFPTSRIR